MPEDMRPQFIQDFGQLAKEKTFKQAFKALIWAGMSEEEIETALLLSNNAYIALMLAGGSDEEIETILAPNKSASPERAEMSEEFRRVIGATETIPEDKWRKLQKYFLYFHIKTLVDA